MSENREDEAQEGGARIEDLPASDSDVADEEGEDSSMRAPAPDGDEPWDSDPDEGGEGLRSPSPRPPDPGE